MYIELIVLVRKDWRIEGIPFAQRKIRPTGYESKGIGERRDGSNLFRKKEQLEIAVRAQRKEV
jgi:hypothetical protein